MPFSGDSYAVPAASRDDATPNTVITSADYKLLLDDLETAFNTTTSIGRGGTGATTQAGARTALGLGTISTQAANSVNIDGGAIDGTVIGASSAAAGTFTTLSASGVATFTNNSTTISLEAANPGMQLKDTDTSCEAFIGTNAAGMLWLRSDPNNEQPASLIRFDVDGAQEGSLTGAGLRVGDGTAPTVTAEFAGTDAVLLPVGTEAQRPTGAKGYLRFNDDTDQPEYYDGAAWQDLGNDWTELAVTATTSGTAIDLTSIPSGVKEIEIWFDRVSGNSTDDFLIQIGTGGSPTTSGYEGGSGLSGSGTSRVASTAGFPIFSAGAAYSISGQMHIYQIDTNDWVSHHSVLADPSIGVGSQGGGSVTLAGALDNVRITSLAGTQTFDAGQLRVRYR